MKKVLLSIISISLLLSCFCSCSKKAADKKITLVMAEVNPETSVCGRMDAAFKAKVEELSKGNITIDLQYSGILGDESQILKLMFDKNSTSEIHIARVSANLSSYGVQKSGIISVPYTFSNAEHFWKFANSDLAKEILLTPYEEGLGVRGLCYAEEGFRNFFTTKKLTSVEDFKGAKMRVSGQVLTNLAVSLNAVPVKVPFTDLYIALQTGQVEVADQPISNYLTNSFYKTAPYMVLDGHMLGAVQILISSKAWDGLSPNQQAIIDEAAKYASNYCKKICAEEELIAIQKLEDEGVEFISVDDITPWQDACKDMINSSVSETYKSLYTKIVNLGK